MVSLPNRKSSLDLSFDLSLELLLDGCSLVDVARFLEEGFSDVVDVDLRLPRGNAVGSDIVVVCVGYTIDIGGMLSSVFTELIAIDTNCNQLLQIEDKDDWMVITMRV